MNLNKLKQSDVGNLEIARERLRGGEALAVRFERADRTPEGLTVVAELLTNAYKAPAGKRIMIRQAPGISGRDSLEEVVNGSERASKSVPGDIVCFSSSFIKDGIAFVGKATARTHDGIVGKHQVVTAMARCSQSRVTKRGPSQFLTIADGDAAIIAATVEEVIGVLQDAEKRIWPGGDAGLIMRNREGATIEWFNGFDRDAAYLAEELRAEETMVWQRLEVIPAWRIPMGRDQIMREIDPTKEAGPTSGPVTSQFEHKDNRFKQGFLPCVIVLSEEDEWAFKAKTGKKIRVVSGVQPIFGRVPVLANRLPSAVRKNSGNSNTVLQVFSDEEIAKAAARRAALKPPVTCEQAKRNETNDRQNDDYDSGSSVRLGFARRSSGFGRR